jgi:hypothetical protein
MHLNGCQQFVNQKNSAKKQCWLLVTRAYPMIKCNINQSSQENIYHLPFDQQYDRTKINPALGEFYATSVAEAESKGFRRALRYFGG